MPCRPTFELLLFWTHLSAGVLAGLVILTMSVTGVLLTYERQLIEWSDRGFRSVAPADGQNGCRSKRSSPAPPSSGPDQPPTAITLRSDPGGAGDDRHRFGKRLPGCLFGRRLGEPTTRVRSLMSELRAWHRWLSLAGEQRALGKAISGWSNLIFLFIVLSGMYLWIPRT